MQFFILFEVRLPNICEQRIMDNLYEPDQPHQEQRGQDVCEYEEFHRCSVIPAGGSGNVDNPRNVSA